MSDERKLFEVRNDEQGNPVLYYGGEPALVAYHPEPGNGVHVIDYDETGRQRIRKLRDSEPSPLPPGKSWAMWGSAHLSPAGFAALDYARNGIPVFPCKPANKQPLIEHGFKDATVNLTTIAAWWKRWPDALIGMPTGATSGIAVLDLDVKNGKNGLAFVPDWEARSTVIAKTQSGGIHLYFANDDRVRSQSDQIAPGVDTRGNGGYVIVPPSTGYAFTKGDLLDRSILPSWPDDMRPKERERTEPPPLEDSTPITDHERAKVAAALNVITDDSYQTWFEVGSALRHAFGDDGYQLFDQWSAKSPKYDKQECLKQWDGCAAVEKITLGTLFRHADEAAPSWREEFEAKHGKPVIQTGAEFVAGFKPPDYSIDGVLQRGFLYSTTAPTGTGKTAIVLRIAAHVAHGLPLAGREVLKGKVLYFAGENPDDIRTRWIKLCEEMEIDPDTTDVFFVAGTLSISKTRKRIIKEAKVHGPFTLVIVDTLAAYFEGDEENSNVTMARNARMMRSLTEVEGGPTVIVTCHPTKSPNPDNLLPRGGGAFLAEVDGNLVCLKQDGVVDLHWQGKFRGPDFSAMPFKIEAGTSARLKDSKDRPIWTVTARPISSQERGSIENASLQRQGQLVAAMKAEGGLSLAELANALGWTYKEGGPNKGLVKRTMDELHARGLVKKADGGNWTLTTAGKKHTPSDDEQM